MKIITIKKGHHYSNEFFPKFICFRKGYTKTIKRTYVFNDSCKYLIGSDQTDKNKLFGWSYGLHKKNSVRVCWWYNSETNKIELGLYYYVKGNICKKHCLSVDLNIPVTICLTINHMAEEDYWYELIIEQISDSTQKRNAICSETLDFCRIPKWGYLLTSYFGGNQKAPHNITLQYETAN